MKLQIGNLYTIFVLLLAVRTESSERDPKFFSVFQIVKFTNDPCNATESTEGTCYTSAECSSKGGIVSGSCANGFGVCCLFNKGCGDTTSENNTYFSSDSYSSPCILTICKPDSAICQIRLDFDRFVLSQPESSTTPKVTNCIDARFSATSASGTVPVICGTNTGKHMYLDSLDECNVLQIMTTPSATNPDFVIQITQIACTASFKAPYGCLQYHTGTSGTIDSFNIDGAVHLANHFYTICIRTEQGYCNILYDDSSYSLSSGNAVEGNDCTEDYIIIPDNARDNNRFCGGTFGSVDTSQRPFVVLVKFDGADSATTRKEGFKLTYTQSTTDCA